MGTDFDCDGGLIDVSPTLLAQGNKTGGDRPPGTTVDTCESLIVMSSGQANAEITVDLSPALNCNRDGAPIAFSGQMSTPQVDFDMSSTLGAKNPMAVCFKPSHYTRGKDGAPSEIAPPLSADADKGDQEAIVFQPRYARNGRGAPDTVAGPLTAEAGRTGKGDSAQCVAYSIMPMNSGKDFKARETEVAQPIMTAPTGGNQGGDYVLAIRTANTGANGHGIADEVAHTLDQAQGQAIAFTQNQRDEVRTMEPGMKQQTYVATPIQEVGKRTGVSTTDKRAGIGVGAEGDPMFTLQAGAQHGVGVYSAVRRLTPRECERLQGFEDNYTAIPWRGKPADQCPDGPRYKALGNSMAVPVMRWIGKRIQMVEDLCI